MPLQWQGLITIWSDTNINAGTEWEEEINKHLNTADVILLLVSSDFMASEYSYSKEMKRAMERRQIANSQGFHQASQSGLKVYRSANLYASRGALRLFR